MNALFQCECKMPDEVDTDYLAYHTVVKHFDTSYGFQDMQTLKQKVAEWLMFSTEQDKSAMGPNLMKKCKTFPIYLDDYKKQGKVDEVVLQVISQIIREPVAILLCGEFWMTTEEYAIGNVQFLFVFGGEGCFIPIHWMMMMMKCQTQSKVKLPSSSLVDLCVSML